MLPCCFIIAGTTATRQQGARVGKLWKTLVGGRGWKTMAHYKHSNPRPKIFHGH
ncbi:hypothetical protein PM082_021667 [Marasmius tenuissimus]|nr:hypothetical protein PM082_021667 [Marasmius tenuissimus]